MAETLIEWADYTFNPWRGCRKKSPGCKFCYAESRAGRFGEDFANRRIVLAEAGWKKPLQWNAKAKATQTRLKVFCLSLGDVFEDWSGPIVNHFGCGLYRCMSCGVWLDGAIPSVQGAIGPFCSPCQKHTIALTIDDLRRRLFALIDATPWLDWILVTKRPENIRRMWCQYGPEKKGQRLGQPIFRENVWLLTSVENQEQAEERIPHLVKCRDLSPVLGLSCEPFLGPLDLSGWLTKPQWGKPNKDGLRPHEVVPRNDLVNWIIAGGESGPHARPMHPDWARGLRDQCQAAEVPFFFKQWGEWEPLRLAKESDLLDARKQVIVRRGGGISSGLAPYSCDDYVMSKVGKKQAGRLLDGREWSEFPQAFSQGA